MLELSGTAVYDAPGVQLSPLSSCSSKPSPLARWLLQLVPATSTSGTRTQFTTISPLQWTGPRRMVCPAIGTSDIAPHQRSTNSYTASVVPARKYNRAWRHTAAARIQVASSLPTRGQGALLPPVRRQSMSPPYTSPIPDCWLSNGTASRAVQIPMRGAGMGRRRATRHFDQRWRRQKGCLCVNIEEGEAT